MTNKERCQDMYAMCEQGQMMDAFEKYYAEDVQVVEGNGEVRNGKEAQRSALAQWAGSIQEVHAQWSGPVMADDENGITSIESWVEATFQGGHRMKMEEVAVQKWQDGKIVHERFYHNMPPMK